MKIITYIVVFIVATVVIGLLYVRLAPTNVARLHQPIEAVEDAKFEWGAIRVIDADAPALERVNAAALTLPRTEVIAGSVKEGRITYRTRSKWIGFPDFTTVEYTDGKLKMLARLRFGKSDFGVNAARLEQLLVIAKLGGE